MTDSLDILIDRAKEVATRVHSGQFRWDKKTPYVTHPEAVAEACQGRAKVVAWLHDCIEDAKNPLEVSAEIKNIFPIWVYNAVVEMTKRPNEDYDLYILRVSNNEFAREVKIADIRHNLSGGDCSRKRTEKYTKALKTLEEKP